MGQLSMANLGGVHWVSGQSKGQGLKSTRGGIERDKLGIVGPTEVVGKPPQSGGVGGLSCCTGQLVALQLTLESCGAH